MRVCVCFWGVWSKFYQTLLWVKLFLTPPYWNAHVWAIQIIKKKLSIWSLFESIKIKCFIYTIQNKNRNHKSNSSDVWYKKIQCTIYFFYTGSWIYKTILHRNIILFFFFNFQHMLTRTTTTRRPDYSGLLRALDQTLLWVISHLYSNKSLIHLFYTGVSQLMGLI